MKKSIVFLSAIIIGLIGKPGIAMENHFNTKNKPHTLLAALYKKEQQKNCSIADFVTPEDKTLVGPLAAANTKEKSQEKGKLGKRGLIQQFTNQPLKMPTFDNFEKSIQLADGKYGIFNDLEINQFQLFKDLSVDFNDFINHFDLSKSGISKKTFHKLLEIIKTSADKREKLLQQCSSDEIADLFNACLYLGPVEEVTKLCAHAILQSFNFDLMPQAYDVLKKSNNVHQFLHSGDGDRRFTVFLKAKNDGILDLSDLKLCSLEGLEDLCEHIDSSKINEINLDYNHLQELSITSLIKLFPQLKKLCAKNNLITTCDLNELYLLESTDLSNNLIEKVKDLSLINRYKYAWEYRKFLKKITINLDGNKIKDGTGNLLRVQNCLLSNTDISAVLDWPRNNKSLFQGIAPFFPVIALGMLWVHAQGVISVKDFFVKFCHASENAGFSSALVISSFIQLCIMEKLNALFGYDQQLKSQKANLLQKLVLQSTGKNGILNKNMIDVEFSNNEKYHVEISHAPGKEEESDEEE